MYPVVTPSSESFLMRAARLAATGALSIALGLAGLAESAFSQQSQRPTRPMATQAGAPAGAGAPAEVRSGTPAGPMLQPEPRMIPTRTVKSADGVDTRIEDLTRIVTLGGAITETVYALGFGSNVVGTDQSSLFPVEVFRKPRLSVFRESSAEGILSLNPTLVIAPAGIRPLTVPKQLRDAGVPVLLLEDAYSPAQAAKRTSDLAQALDEGEKAEALIAGMQQALGQAKELQNAQERKPRVLFVYTRGASMVNVSGRGTAGDAVISLAGGVNVVSEFEGYRPLTAEAAVSAAPDIILVPQHGLDMIGGMENFLRQPGLSLTPAAKNGNIMAVDDALLLSFGPRLGQGVLELTRKMIDALEMAE